MRAASEVAESLRNENGSLWKDLAGAVEGSADAGPWTNIPFTELLAKPDETTQPGWLTILSMIRDLGFLAPVAITWFELREAFGAFQESDNEGSSFISEWQDGFDGVTTPFGEVAFRIVVALAVVAGLSALVAFVRASSESVARSAVASRRELLLEASFHIGDQYTQSQLTDDQLEKLDTRVKQLDGSLNDMNDLLDQLSATVAPVTASLNKSMSDHIDVKQDLASLMHHFEAYSQSAKGQLDSLSTNLHQTVQFGSASTEAAKKMRDASSVMQTSSEDIAAAISEQGQLLAENLEVLRQSAQLANQLSTILTDLRLEVDQINSASAQGAS